MNEHRIRCNLGPLAVDVHTNDTVVSDYLAQFYTFVDPTPASILPIPWVIDARTGAGGSMPCNRWGVGYVADARARRVLLRHPKADNLAVTTRKVVREVLVDFCERQRYTMLHASAFADKDWVVVVVGDKGSGKTTLALRAALEHGFRFLSNDHLIIYADEVSPAEEPVLVLTSLPTLVPVKVGTYLDLEHLLPTPWDSEGLDVDHYRKMPRAERYRYDQRLLYTFRQLGQDNPIAIHVDRPTNGPRVTVVLASYRPAQQPVGAPEPIAAQVDEMRAHIRSDWMFDPDLNQRHLPRNERDRPTYQADCDRS
ncbi:MAG TPA: hypothetical protein DGG94_04785 [Micromonosporaceae bacterium]|nr:hypothetical protein [Micromonosporaceae bacterium]